MMVSATVRGSLALAFLLTLLAGHQCSPVLAQSSTNGARDTDIAPDVETQHLSGPEESCPAGQACASGLFGTPSLQLPDWRPQQIRERLDTAMDRLYSVDSIQEALEELRVIAAIAEAWGKDVAPVHRQRHDPWAAAWQQQSARSKYGLESSDSSGTIIAASEDADSAAIDPAPDGPDGAVSRAGDPSTAAAAVGDDGPDFADVPPPTAESSPADGAAHRLQEDGTTQVGTEQPRRVEGGDLAPQAAPDPSELAVRASEEERQEAAEAAAPALYVLAALTSSGLLPELATARLGDSVSAHHLAARLGHRDSLVALMDRFLTGAGTGEPPNLDFAANALPCYVPSCVYICGPISGGDCGIRPRISVLAGVEAQH